MMPDDGAAAPLQRYPSGFASPKGAAAAPGSLAKDFAVPRTRGFIDYFRQGRLNFVDAVSFGALALGAAAWWRGSVPRWLFLAAFVFWRLTYNVGLGLVLRRQSRSEWFTETTRRLSRAHPRLLDDWIKPAVRIKMDRDYSFASLPPEYNAWLVFRLLVDLVLFHDVIAYGLFALAYGHFRIHSAADALRVPAGLLLIAFNAWVKSDAHRVVKDYAWYWGDFFFQLEGALTFDGVFELAPHPMYSLGYTWYYGVSLLCGSYTVFFVSLAAHMLQMAFLVLVETPHMDKIYYQRQRKMDSFAERGNVDANMHADMNMNMDTSTNTGTCTDADMVLLFGFDVGRASDLMTALFVGSTVVVHVMNVLPTWFVVAECAAWRLLYVGIVGCVLWGEDRNRTWTRHHIRCGRTPGEAFAHWKVLLNFVLLMNHTMYAVTALSLYRLPPDWTLHGWLLRHALGGLMVALQAWTGWASYATLGAFGWFYGDFFCPARAAPSYGGIYRYLNDPEESVGQAAYWGLALMGWDWRLWMLAALAMLTNLAFLEGVEGPHMRRVYGDQIRRESGVVRNVKKLPGAVRVAELLGAVGSGLGDWLGRIGVRMLNASRAGRRAPPFNNGETAIIRLDRGRHGLAEAITYRVGGLRADGLRVDGLRVDETNVDESETGESKADGLKADEVAILQAGQIVSRLPLHDKSLPKARGTIPVLRVPWRTGEFQLCALRAGRPVAHSEPFSIESVHDDDRAKDSGISAAAVAGQLQRLLAHDDGSGLVWDRLSEGICSLYDVEFHPSILRRHAGSPEALASLIVRSHSALHATDTL